MPMMAERKMPMCEEIRDGCLRACTAGVGVVSAAMEVSVGMRGWKDSSERIDIRGFEPPLSSVRLSRVDLRLLGLSDSDLRVTMCGSIYMLIRTGAGNWDDSRFGKIYAYHGYEKHESLK